MSMELAALDYKSLIELTSDRVLKAKFAKVPIAPFWSSVIEEYESFFKKKQHKRYYRLRLRSCANQVFPIYTNKSKYRATLDITPDIRIQLSNIKPSFSVLSHSRK